VLWSDDGYDSIRRVKWVRGLLAKALL